jgi:DNA modification methylase
MKREPYVDDSDFQLFVGDALEVLRDLPSESVHCALTSPPFY